MKKLILIFMIITVVFSAQAGIFGGNFNYITGDELAKWIKEKKQFFIVDIQPKKDFDDEHIVNALPTYAFPVQTDDDRKKLDSVINKIKPGILQIVVVCPRGKKGAEGAYHYIKSKGIDEKRLYILKGGMGDWSHNEYSEPK